jgi:hypothetical protein
MPATVDDRDVHWHTHRIGARDRPVHDGGCIAQRDVHFPLLRSMFCD